jgi:conjugative transfer signal peptidase TraF
MMHPGRFKRHRTLRIAIVMAIAFAGPFFLASATGIRINVSPSLPLGLYRQTSDPAAQLAEFCPQKPYGRFASERGYRSAGNCPDGAAPLMKPVVATFGDVVNISSRGIAVNGILLPNTAPKMRDARGRLMKPWRSGEYRVERGDVWLGSSYSPWSYDSRYFGPVPESSIRARLKPILTY